MKFESPWPVPISIHALRVEGDYSGQQIVQIGSGISIHALRVEGDVGYVQSFFDAISFLSTPSGWRATLRGWTGERGDARFLSTPSGWRATADCRYTRGGGRFLSTPSGWRATSPPYTSRIEPDISIHALRVEGDLIRSAIYFTLSMSIHALRVEGDRKDVAVFERSRNFYPRPPGGGRLDHPSAAPFWLNFYPRPPGGGRQKMRRLTCPSKKHFYPRPPGGGRLARPGIYMAGYRFLSTPSGWRATAKTDKVFICFCAKGRRICLFKTREEKICRWRFKKDKFWVLIWCEGSGKSVCASASHCG